MRGHHSGALTQNVQCDGCANGLRHGSVQRTARVHDVVVGVAWSERQHTSGVLNNTKTPTFKPEKTCIDKKLFHVKLMDLVVF